MKLISPLRKVVGMSKRDHGNLPDENQTKIYHPGVGFIFQNHLNLCGDACANMLLKFHGKQPKSALVQSSGHTGVLKMVSNPRGVLKGTQSQDLITMLDTSDLWIYQFYTTEPFAPNTIGFVLSDFGPFIAAVQFNRFAGHAILVFGVQGDQIFYHDPWRGANKSMSIAEFNKISNPTRGEFITVSPAKVDTTSLRDDGIIVESKGFPLVRTA
jgi:hypothetical protein